MSRTNYVGGVLRDLAVWGGNLAGDSLRLALTFWQLPLRLLLPERRKRREQTAVRRRLDSLVMRVHRLLRIAREDGLSEEFFSGLHRLADRREEIERAVVVWVGLIEVLVQDAERRYGAQRGRGAIKAAEVKSAVLYLVRRQNLKFPDVPDLLVPILMNALVDWVVDALVQQLNRFGLWVDTTPEPPTLGMRVALLLKGIWKGLKKVLWALAKPFVWLAVKLGGWLRPEMPLSPELKSALEAVSREGLLSKGGQFLGWVFDVVRWVGEHREQLTALTDVAFEAVQEAETFINMPGPEKKAYARELILAVLEELGFRQRFGLLFSFIEVLIDAVIEVAVYLFRKHGIFSRGRAA